MALKCLLCGIVLLRNYMIAYCLFSTFRAQICEHVTHRIGEDCLTAKQSLYGLMVKV